VVLVGLAAKNAILIVEFARDIELEGRSRLEAVIEACRLRLRPILMTSFAFILGVLPLVVSTSSGSEMRQAVGVAVFFGMLGVTLFGLIFTPIFYMVVRNLAEGKNEGKPTQTTAAAAGRVAVTPMRDEAGTLSPSPLGARNARLEGCAAPPAPFTLRGSLRSAPHVGRP
jgi:predicted RND superfamily exporter protein